jgi:hypothetical protein
MNRRRRAGDWVIDHDKPAHGERVGKLGLARVTKGRGTDGVLLIRLQAEMKRPQE